MTLGQSEDNNHASKVRSFLARDQYDWFSASENGSVYQVFEHMGYQQVKTLGASGNGLFATLEVNQMARSKELEEKLETAFGYSIRVLVRTLSENQALVESDSFKSISVTPIPSFLSPFSQQDRTPR